MALPRAAPPNWPDVEALPIVHCSFGKCQGETKGDYHSDDDQNRGGGEGVEVAVHALLDTGSSTTNPAKVEAYYR